MTRKVTRKRASASKEKPQPEPRVVKDAEIDSDANNAARDGEVSNGPPKIHAKVVQLQVSIGTHDRDRTHEQFVEDLMKLLGKVPYGQEGIHASKTGGYYILDGRVCIPEDYDPKTQNFKPGAVPPSWAGGPKKSAIPSAQSQMQYDLEHLSRDAYDKKYGLGKYKNTGDRARIITPEMQAQKREEWRIAKQKKEEADIEDFDWDVSDASDSDGLSKEADKTTARAIKRLKGASASKKRVVVKKKAATEPPKKRVVRKVKR